MRIRANDPGADTAVVKWDGVLVTNCVDVDTVAGWADLIIADDGGKIVINPEGDGPLIERVFGNFTVEWRR